MGKSICGLLIFFGFGILASGQIVVAADVSKTPTALGFKVKSLAGDEVQLNKKYQGRVLLVVNVASQCGLTPQYEQLQALHEKYGQQGLAVLGFPCNQFGRQEPGTPSDIDSFCKKNYGVTFDMFEKIDVNGGNASPLYKHLTKVSTKPKGAGKVSWNFEKFLIDRDGKVVARFQPGLKPDDPKVIAEIEKSLKGS
ncbi:MAG: glutathione peroxidase [Pirellulaceae bacterium]|nr:glutathione peroxidase [Pirellulaceae bacterium]